MTVQDFLTHGQWADGESTYFGGGINAVYQHALVLEGERLEVLYKNADEMTRQESAREAAVHYLARLTGLVRVPEGTLRQSPPRTPAFRRVRRVWVQELVEALGHECGPSFAEARAEILDLAVFDMLIANRDRHSHNYLTTPDRHLVAIDHGLTLGSQTYALLDFIPSQWSWDIRDRGTWPLRLTDRQQEAVRRVLDNEQDIRAFCSKNRLGSAVNLPALFTRAAALLEGRL